MQERKDQLLCAIQRTAKNVGLRENGRYFGNGRTKEQINKYISLKMYFIKIK